MFDKMSHKDDEVHVCPPARGMCYSDAAGRIISYKMFSEVNSREKTLNLQCSQMHSLLTPQSPTVGPYCLLSLDVSALICFAPLRARTFEGHCSVVTPITSRL